MRNSIEEHFSQLEDPRVERNQLHGFVDVLILVIRAVTSGAEGWEAIERFGKAKLQWLRQFAPFANGVPSHDCIANVISRLSAKGFQACFANRVIATAEKSNEITEIPELLELLELTGCLVTIEAMGCQREIAGQIIDQGGEYMLGLKGNQSALHEAVKDFFTVAQAGEFAGVDHDSYEVDKDHGRLEMRHYWITEELRTLPNTEPWRGLRSIGLVERNCLIGETETGERFFCERDPGRCAAFRARRAGTLGGGKSASLAT